MKALSPTDTLFLLLEGRRMPMHVGGLQLLSPPENAGPNYIAELVEGFRAAAEAVLPFNQHLVFRFGRWFWTEDREFDIGHHVTHSALPAPGRVRELLATVSRLHANLLDRTRPLWEMHVIEGLEDGRFAIYIKVHHALYDGVSAMRTIQRALSSAPDERGRPPFWQMEKVRRIRHLPETAAINPLAAARGAARANLRVIPGFARGLWDVLRDSRANPADVTPLQAPPSILNVPISGARRFAAQSFGLDRLKAVARNHGVTLNDACLAVCAGALRDYLLSQQALPEDPLVAMVPVSVRAADDLDEGNQVAMMLANLGTHIVDPAERIACIHASTEFAKARLQRMSRVEQIAFAAALASPLPLSSALRLDRIHPVFNVVISNVPGPHDPLYWNGARVDETYPLSIPIDGQALNITMNSYNGQMAFGYTACRRAVPQMQRLLDFTEAAITALEQG